MENKLPRFVIGIDPGETGGHCILKISAKPEIIDIKPYGRPCRLPLNLTLAHVFLEAVGSSPAMGVVSAFTFGGNFGYWEGILERSFPASITLMRPAQWQTALACRAKGDKSKLKDMALRLSGNDKRITLKTADAFLLAEYGRRSIYSTLV